MSCAFPDGTNGAHQSVQSPDVIRQRDHHRTQPCDNVSTETCSASTGVQDLGLKLHPIAVTPEQHPEQDRHGWSTITEYVLAAPTPGLTESRGLSND